MTELHVRAVARLFKSAVSRDAAKPVSSEPSPSAAGRHSRRGLIRLAPALVVAVLILASLPATVAAAGGTAQTITFATVTQGVTVGASGVVVSATATSGLAVAYSSTTGSICSVNASSGALTLLAAGTCTIAADQAGNGTYAAAPTVTQGVTVGKGDQTIGFTSAAPGARQVGGATYTATATSTSGLTVALTIDGTASTVCSIAGGVVSFIGVGTCKIDANQAGTVDWNTATQVQNSFAVGIGSQTISFGTTAPTAAQVGGATYTPTATATSGLTVVLSIDSSSSAVCSINSGGVVSFIGVGTCKIDANQAGTVNWTAATQVQQSFGVGINAQTISFGTTAPTAAKVGGATYTPTAAATSGLTVVLSIDSSSSAVCSISAGVVSFTGAGSCVIDANQAGNANWTAAPQVQQSFLVGTLPTAPTNLSATALSTSSIQFNWKDNSTDELGFYIYRWSVPDGSAWVYAGWSGVNTTSFVDTGLTANTNYFYYACAYDSTGQICSPGYVWATTLATVLLPTAPTNISATALSSSAIDFVWADNSSNETGFWIYRWSAADGSVWKNIATTAANATTFHDTGLTASTNYFYYACAFNSAVGKNCSPGYVWTTTLAAVTIPLPTAPLNGTATALSSSSIQFNWTDNSNNELGFKIYHWSVADGSVWKLAGTTAANATSFTDAGLTANTNYFYYACAYNSTGLNCSPGIVSATTPPTAVVVLPIAPTNGAVTALSSSSLQFNWTDNSNDELGFKIYHWSVADGSVWKLAGTTAANATSFTDTGLTANTNYFYYACAYDSALRLSCAPSYSTGTTSPVIPLPAAPANGTATTLTSNSIQFNWTDNSNNELGFKIYHWSVADGSVWKLVTTTAPNATSFADTGLTASTNYFYYACAFNSSGTSCAPGYSTGTTLP